MIFARKALCAPDACAVFGAFLLFEGAHSINGRKSEEARKHGR